MGISQKTDPPVAASGQVFRRDPPHFRRIVGDMVKPAPRIGHAHHPDTGFPFHSLQKRSADPGSQDHPVHPLRQRSHAPAGAPVKIFKDHKAVAAVQTALHRRNQRTVKRCLQQMRIRVAERQRHIPLFPHISTLARNPVDQILRFKLIDRLVHGHEIDIVIQRQLFHARQRAGKFPRFDPLPQLLRDPVIFIGQIGAHLILLSLIAVLRL